MKHAYYRFEAFAKFGLICHNAVVEQRMLKFCLNHLASADSVVRTANCPVTPHVQVEELSFSRKMFHHQPFGKYDVKCLHQMAYTRKIKVAYLRLRIASLRLS